MPINLGAILPSSPPLLGAGAVSRIYLGASLVFEAGDTTPPDVTDQTWDDVAREGSLSVSEPGTLYLATYDSAGGQPTRDPLGGWVGTTLEEFTDSLSVGLNTIAFAETAASLSATHFAYYVRDAAGNNSAVTYQAYTPSPSAWTVADNSDGTYTVTASQASPVIPSVVDNGDGTYTVS